MSKLLDRINELANKEKTKGLTKEEKKEQKELRDKYLENFRGRMKESLMNLKVVDQEGKDITPEKLKEEQRMHRKDNLN